MTHCQGRLEHVLQCSSWRRKHQYRASNITSQHEAIVYKRDGGTRSRGSERNPGRVTGSEGDGSGPQDECCSNSHQSLTHLQPFCHGNSETHHSGDAQHRGGDPVQRDVKNVGQREEVHTDDEADHRWNQLRKTRRDQQDHSHENGQGLKEAYSVETPLPSILRLHRGDPGASDEPPEEAGCNHP